MPWGRVLRTVPRFCLTNVIAVALEAEFPFTVGHAGFAFAHDECTDFGHDGR
ncbi:hypothetical protein N9573_01400 [Octadecabacter sp.]|nr:hypothetical protein [Octadecabacter sp.]